MAGRVLAPLLKWLLNFNFLIYMWKFTLYDGTVVTGNREEIAKEFNFFDDVYDDEVWDDFCYGFNVEWIDEDGNVDNYVHLTDEEYEELMAIFEEKNL